ncbi:MAG: aminomethyl-transferring glycine dehydrogenase subunit GcvPB, partial [Rhodospirillales bacterium]
GAMLVEPTETEGKRTLDIFIDALRGLVQKARDGEGEILRNAPYLTPRRRLDETGAARHPVLRWTPDQSKAAE